MLSKEKQQMKLTVKFNSGWELTLQLKSKYGQTGFWFGRCVNYGDWRGIYLVFGSLIRGKYWKFCPIVGRKWIDSI